MGSSRQLGSSKTNAGNQWKPLAAGLEGRRPKQSALKRWGRTGDAIQRPQRRGTRPCHELAGSQHSVCWHREPGSILAKASKTLLFLSFLPKMLSDFCFGELTACQGSRLCQKLGKELLSGWGTGGWGALSKATGCP